MKPPGAADSPAARLVAEADRWRKRLRRAARATRHRADPEAIHDTRVAVRRLDALLGLLRGVLPREERRARRRELHALRRALGAAREAQVGVALLRERLGHAPGAARIAGGFVLDRLGRRAARRERDAARACARPHLARISRRLRGTLHTALARGPVEPAWLPEAHARLAARVAKAHAVLAAALDAGTDEALHRARIAVKRTRYGIEGLAVLEPGARPAAPAAALAGVQEVLGRIQDIALLRTRLAASRRRLTAASAAALEPLDQDLDQERDEALARLRARVRDLPPPSALRLLGPAA